MAVIGFDKLIHIENGDETYKHQKIDWKHIYNPMISDY